MSVNDTKAVNPIHRKIADEVAKSHMSYDAEKREIVVDGKAALDTAITAYNEAENVTLDKKAVQTAFSFAAAYAAGTGLATGEIGIDAMAKDKEVNNLTATFPLAKQVTVTHNVARTQVGRNMKTNEEIVNHGVLSTNLDMRSIKSGSNSEWKAMRDSLKQMGEEKLNK